MNILKYLGDIVFWRRRLALRQIAALCYRSAGSDLEFLLITTRTRGVWIIPRGWPRASVADAGMAALEAMEEAGVEGHVTAEPIGAYHYDKHLKRGETLPCRTVVYGLEVTAEHDKWKEQKQRVREWVTREEAAKRIKLPELRDLILEFQPNDSKDPL